MVLIPEIMTADVMHAREVVARNAFSYKVLFLRLSVDALQEKRRGFLRGINRFAVLSVFERDHGRRKSDDIGGWLDEILTHADLTDQVETIQLMTLPRVLGYAFKPVSFWFCLNKSGAPVAVISEVNNTFGETHSYICKRTDGAVLSGSDVIKADKVFHVSPFMDRDGSYEFRFAYHQDRVNVRIDQFAPDGTLRLRTSVKAKTLKAGSRIGAFFAGLRSLMVFPLILWQAFKLWRKKVAYVPKPEQIATRVTTGSTPGSTHV